MPRRANFYCFATWSIGELTAPIRQKDPRIAQKSYTFQQAVGERDDRRWILLPAGAFGNDLAQIYLFTQFYRHDVANA